MSERLIKIIGITFIILGIALCVNPLFFFGDGGETQLCSVECGEAETGAIPIEQNGSVNVNDADEEELTSLYGVGESIAAMIVMERTENGPYFYAEDLQAVRGIGPLSLEKFRQDINLTKDESGE